jgi:hypothetical protein
MAVLSILKENEGEKMATVHTMRTKRGMRYYIILANGRYRFVKKP